MLTGFSELPENIGAVAKLMGEGFVYTLVAQAEGGRSGSRDFRRFMCSALFQLQQLIPGLAAADQPYRASVDQQFRR